MNNLDLRPDEQLSPANSRSSDPKSRSPSGTPTPVNLRRSRKNSSCRSDGIGRGNAVLLGFMSANNLDVINAESRGHECGSSCGSGSDSEESDEEIDNHRENGLSNPPRDFGMQVPNGDHYANQKVDETHRRSYHHESNGKSRGLYQKPLQLMTKVKEECKYGEIAYSPISPGSVAYGKIHFELENKDGGSIGASLSMPRHLMIKGSPEQKLKPLTNSGTPSRQTTGDSQNPQRLPSLQDVIFDMIPPRSPEVNIRRCLSPTSPNDEQSPSCGSRTSSRTMSLHSPVKSQADYRRSHPRSTPGDQSGQRPPLLPSTSSGGSTTAPSGRSDSICTTTDSATTAQTSSDTVSPPEPSQLDATLYSGGYLCNSRGCTAQPFQTQYLLNSHKNVHSLERPHYCPMAGCKRAEGGKGFKRKNEMIRHGLVHSSPGYVCPYCPDRSHTYPRPDNLQRHVSLHHKEKDKGDPTLRHVLAQRPPGMGFTSSRRRRT